MLVRNVQNAILAAVAVSGMKGADASAPRAASVPNAAMRQSAPARRSREMSVQEAGDTPVNASAAEKTQEKVKEFDSALQPAHDPLSEEQTAFITEQLNEIMRSINVDLEFQYHKEVNFMSVRMLDKKTGEVLREVPPEAMVEHMIKVHDWIGAFLDRTA